MEKQSKLSIMLKGFIKENPVFVLVLGTCPTLAVTDSVSRALSMGIAAAIVLICSNMAISALRKVIPDKVRIPAYIVIIAGFVTLIQMLMNAYLPDLFTALGTYLALIVVNCIILGRAEMFASKHTVVESALDGIGMGGGFTLALFCMGTRPRDPGLSGSFLGFKIPFLQDYSIPFFTQAAGGFFVFGVLIAVVNKITKGKAISKKEFGCANCPSRSACLENPKTPDQQRRPSNIWILSRRFL